MLDSATDRKYDSPAKRLLRRLEALSRYDLTLAVIPAAFVLSMLAGQLLSLSSRTVLVGASVVGALALLDGLFLHPPEPGSKR